jgi:hypothetical protein
MFGPALRDWMFDVPHFNTPSLRAASREFASWQVVLPLARAKTP